MKLPLLSSALVFLAASAQAQRIALYDAGTPGNPAVAPDPITQGWGRFGSSGMVTAAPLSPDGTTGFNAWGIQDSGVGTLYYTSLLTPQNIADARNGGWALTVRMRPIATNGINMFVEYSEGVTATDDRYIMFFTVAGTDVIAENPFSGDSYLCPGGADGSHHVYVLRKAAGAATVDGEFLYDGTPLGVLTRTRLVGGTPREGVVKWGAASPSATCEVNFNRVEFRIGPLVTVFCTAKTGLACGTPSISGSGEPSASASSGFVITAGPARSCRSGNLLYNTSQAGAPVPFHGGTLCVTPAGLRRAGSTSSGGTPGNNCDGVFVIDMNAFALGQWVVPDCAGGPSGTAPNNPAAFLTVAGTAVFAQYWGRDSVATGSFVSDGANWTVGP